MSIETLREALKDESGSRLHFFWMSLSPYGAECWKDFRTDILALIDHERKEAVREFSLQVTRDNYESSQPRPLTLADWERAMKDPAVLKTFVRRDGKPHGYIKVLCVDAPGEQPIFVSDIRGNFERYNEDGSYIANHQYQADLLLPPRKLNKKVVYVMPKWLVLDEGVLDKLTASHTLPVTLTWESP
jgi:hypothetical protein